MNTRTRNAAYHGTSRTGVNHLKAYCLIGATATALVAFTAVAVVTRPAPTDAAHCVVGAMPGNSAHVLVDLTDRKAPSATQLTKIKSEIRALAASLGDGDRLELVVLAAPSAQKHAALRTVFSGCRPQAPDSAGLSKGKRVLEQQLESAWIEPVEQALATIESRAGIASVSSPLIASMQQIRARMDGRHRKLVVYSDLVEHTEIVSMYGTVPDFKKLRAARLDIALVDGLFAGIEVDIFQLAEAQAAPHQARVRSFWDDWLAATGGRIRFSRI